MFDTDSPQQTEPPKTNRRSWKFFLTEFIMIFLAVFCGFLAENLREDIADRKEETKYMRLLVEDLQADTALIKTNIRNIDAAVANIDSLLVFLRHHRNLEFIDTVFDNRNRLSLPYLYFNPADRATSQLKNGGLKLIENEKISKEILDYWTLGYATSDTQERYNAYRLKAREIYYAIFSISDVYVMQNEPSETTNKFPAVKSQLFRLSEYANYMATCGTVIKGQKNRLIRQRDSAILLINSIKEAYSL